MGVEKVFEIADTTMRDGAQMHGIQFALREKLELIEILDDFGVDIIECGWAGANPVDTKLFRQISDRTTQKSQLSAFCSTYHPQKSVVEDKLFQVATSVDVPVMTVFAKTWDLHVTQGLGIELTKNLQIINEVVTYLKKQFDRVIFDAEHFFDGYKNNPSYALEAINIALAAGADRLVLCDTNGGALPEDIEAALERIECEIPLSKIGFHGHNDAEMAVANSVAALKNGIKQVQGTINGIGERCGNTNLCSLIPNLLLKYNSHSKFIDKKTLPKLKSVSARVAGMTEHALNPQLPYIGDNAFTHKAGIHISGVLKNASLYEHMVPEKVGNKRRIVVSSQAGKSALKHKIERMGYEDVSESKLIELLAVVKERSSGGINYDNYEDSLNLLIRQLFEAKQIQLVVISIQETQHNEDYSVKASIEVNSDLYSREAKAHSFIDAFNLLLYRLLRELSLCSLMLKVMETRVDSFFCSEKLAAVKRVKLLVEAPNGKVRKYCHVQAPDEFDPVYATLIEAYQDGILTSSLPHPTVLE